MGSGVSAFCEDLAAEDAQMRSLQAQQAQMNRPLSQWAFDLESRMGKTPRNSHTPPSSQGPENRHALEVGLSRPRLGAGSPVTDNSKLTDLVMVGTGNEHQRPRARATGAGRRRRGDCPACEPGRACIQASHRGASLAEIGCRRRYVLSEQVFGRRKEPPACVSWVSTPV